MTADAYLCRYLIIRFCVSEVFLVPADLELDAERGDLQTKPL